MVRYPLSVKEINDSDKVKLIACGSNFNICYTEQGILYYWGMLVPDDHEGVQWFPNFMPISIPKEDYSHDE